MVPLLGLAIAALAGPPKPAAPAAKNTQTLTSGWRFRQVGKETWTPATVPGCVHTDLLAAGQIPDPLYRDNELQLQWIGKVDWEYETTFTITPETLQQANVELVFQGLDTYADVTLNEVAVLHSDNMFREWRASVKPQLRVGPNRLHVRFRSPLKEVAGLPAKAGFSLYAGNDEQSMTVVGEKGPPLSPYTRKAPYQYGWDWGPRLVTSGIWQPVKLEAWTEARLTNLHLVQRTLTPERAELTTEVEYEAGAATTATLQLETRGPDGQLAHPTINQPVSLTPGRHVLMVPLQLEKPQRWFPAGYGAQPLYTVTAQLVLNGQALDKSTRRIGLRTLEVRRQADQYGKSFEFVVNGLPIFAKGANWIPADIFPNRVTPGKYRQLLQAAKAANMNMVRVWGGGIYENDVFYDLCDELGLLVWQDFMFACTFYPGDNAFFSNVRQEATYQVRRLRHHPSLAIWVGNNENEVAWQDWNMPAIIGAAHQKQVWGDYLRLFNDLLPSVLREQDPSRLYWPSSPSANYEDLASRQRNGDMHYWAVWAGTDPLSAYEQQVPRFMSEYGFQSFPELKSVQQYALPTDFDIASPVMRQHQRSQAGNPRLLEYLRRDFREPKDFPAFLYVSQVLQAHAIKLAAEHLRRNRPRVMGSLYWQLNDCWGGASWSSIDYYGRWKALQYYARRFYAPVLVSPHEEGDTVRIYVVSDRTAPVPARLQVRLLDFNGKVLYKQAQALQIDPLTSRSYLDIPRAKLLQGHDPKQVVLSCEVQEADGTMLTANTHYFAPPKDINLPAARVATTWKQLNDSTFQLTLKSKQLVRDVNLSLAQGDGFFEDNYFDLLPGQARRVILRPAAGTTAAELRQRLRVQSLVDAF
ncbi:beta-mannosidase [Hymenobacter guriensis]|uniref:Beta-mannosidase B n=1 Tax=Hymenobacter guriensis TaxID=2793065 RepID=A0ABS0L009_9BACT|nr:glycoside hydrolase family 2 protein [Hymenobacter guriensis]MBG8553451.1 glycoside hydrolase family 2 protein [Hymenobacter guriensis]